MPSHSIPHNSTRTQALIRNVAPQLSGLLSFKHEKPSESNVKSMEADAPLFLEHFALIQVIPKHAATLTKWAAINGWDFQRSLRD